MGKFNLSYFKKYKKDGSILIALCDIRNENCLAKEIPGPVNVCFFYDEFGNSPIPVSMRKMHRL